jgi:acetoacetyl-CoA synthetase
MSSSPKDVHQGASSSDGVGEILWEASGERRTASKMMQWIKSVERKIGGRNFGSPADIHLWSVTDTAAFWQSIVDFAGIKWHSRPKGVWLAPPTGHMRGSTWFPGGTLNYAEHLLDVPTDHGGEAVVAVSEGQPQGHPWKRTGWTRAQMRREVARIQHGLRAAGVVPGDRVAGVVSNGAEALIAMLAATGLGAVWASCSPDFGAQAVLDRFSQIEPKVIFFTTAYSYGGKVHDTLPTVRACLEQIRSLRSAVLIEGPTRPELAGSPQCTPVPWQDFGRSAQTPEEPTWVPVPFDAPLWILFSSGTTGVPKCIVHSVGGTLLQHQKELLLHSDITDQSTLLYFTTCGWMMWNWTVSALATGAKLILFDGSPGAPHWIWDVVARERVTAFGTSPKFVSSCMAAGLKPREAWDLSALVTVLSTGAPLLPEHFRWVYREVGSDLHLASISGGTDIVSCFMLGNPLLPVRAGEIQGPGLGMAIEAWDETRRKIVGERGELVCTRPFVSMPTGFWNDLGQRKYAAAYFEFFPKTETLPEVWRHGDFVEFTATGGIIVHGRSDATLNPGGVRIGTAEIYRVVETMPGILDSVAIGQRWHDDTRIVLFVRLGAGAELNATKVGEIKSQLRRRLSPRHVPAEVVSVSDVPYTRSGKKMELAVTQAVHGESVQNIAAAANPTCLDEYRRWGQQTRENAGSP